MKGRLQDLIKEIRHTRFDDTARRIIALESKRDELLACTDAVKLLTEAMKIEQQELQTLKGSSDAWPLKDILKKLIEGMDILLTKKDYDGHGWEELMHARDRAKEKLKQLTKP